MLWQPFHWEVRLSIPSDWCAVLGGQVRSHGRSMALAGPEVEAKSLFVHETGDVGHNVLP